jgi:hypothetical protein
LAAFLKELEDLDSMSGPDIMAAMADLPVPQEGSVDGMSFQDAVEVGKTHVMKSYMISNMISLQAKLLPAHNMELHQFLIGLYGEYVIPSSMHRFIQVLRGKELYLGQGDTKRPLVTDQMLRAVWARLRDRLSSLDSPSSMVEVTTAYATHFTDMYVDKHTGKHMTGDRVRILLLTLPFLLRDLIAPEV